MPGIEKTPLRIPDTWAPAWFRTFVVEYMAKADVRNAIGVGISITSEGNSVATLTVDGSVSEAAIEAHNNDPYANANAFALHNSDMNAHAHTTSVDALPTSPQPGARTVVTDSASVTFLAVVTGGGANVVPVFYNGANWIIG
jgi:hypothetical protein